MFQKPLFKESALFLVLVAVLHTVAIKFCLYWTIFEFDSLMHFLGGMLVGFSILWFYFFSQIFAPKQRDYKNFFLIVFLGIVCVGTLWEVFELLTGTAGVDWKHYPSDTALDLLMDFLGACVACVYGQYKEKQTQQYIHNG